MCRIITVVFLLVLSFAQSLFAGPGNGTGLTGVYYGNMDYYNPKATRTDTTVNFNWGTGAPDALMNHAKYSVHWKGQVQPQYSETYTFSTAACGGARLWINNQVVVDNYADQGQVVNTSGTITLVAGQKYDLDLFYFQKSGTGSVSLSWSSASQTSQVIPQSQLYPPASGTGLVGAYSSGTNPSPTLTRTDAAIAFNWGAQTPDPSISGSTFSVVWKGMVQPLYTETYTFYTSTEGDVKLWVNGVLVIQDPARQTRENLGAINLAAGNNYDIQMQYCKGSGSASMQLSWSSPSQSKQVVPQSQLFPPSTNLDSEDPFKVYLTGAAPLIVQTLSTTSANGVTVSKVVFRSRFVDSSTGVRESRVYAYIAQPSAPGKYPGILCLHGGLGSALTDQADIWASKGYVAIAIDEPGVCNPANCPNSSGPWADDPAFNTGFFSGPNPTHDAFFDSCLASMQALYLLRSQASVDTTKIGVTGVSMGGWLTTWVAGMAGNLVNSAFSVFGCGAWDYGSNPNGSLAWAYTSDEQGHTAYLRYCDPARRARGMTANYFVAAATNDFFFFPPSLTVSYGAINSPKNLLYSPNDNHGITQPQPSYQHPANQWLLLGSQSPYFDYLLKGIGQAFPAICVSGTQPQGDGSLLVTFNPVSPAAVQSVKAYYSTPTSAGPAWMGRTWTSITASSIGNGQYRAVIPASVQSQNGIWCGVMTDVNSVTVSTELQPKNLVLGQSSFPSISQSGSNLILNPGFEADAFACTNLAQCPQPSAWTMWSQDPAQSYVEFAQENCQGNGSHNGSMHLVHTGWNRTANAYQGWGNVKTSQMFTGIPNGTYILRARCKANSTVVHGFVAAEAYATNGGWTASAIPVSEVYQQVSVTVPVTNNQCKISLYSYCDTTASYHQVDADDFEFFLDPASLQLAFTTQPVSQIVTSGQTATFTAAAIGIPTPTYQWQKNGVNIPGATLSSYTTPVLSGTDSREQFSVVAANTSGTATSNIAILTVNSHIRSNP